MDIKKIAMVIAITALLPLFIGLFVDAVYLEPEHQDFCNDTYYDYPKYEVATPTNCTYDKGYDDAVNACYRDEGTPRFNHTETGCQIYDSCDYCNKVFNDASQKYNRNIFFILLPVGLIIVIIGIYLSVDYIGAGLMFAGLITMFYATIRYFSEMSKTLRALVILAELLVIMWIGYQKIGGKDEGNKSNRHDTRPAQKNGVGRSAKNSKN